MSNTSAPPWGFYEGALLRSYTPALQTVALRQGLAMEPRLDMNFPSSCCRLQISRMRGLIHLVLPKKKSVEATYGGSCL